VVYKEGSQPDFIYIIKEGEFELTKKQIKEKQTNYKYEKLIGPQEDEMS